MSDVIEKPVTETVANAGAPAADPAPAAAPVPEAPTADEPTGTTEDDDFAFANDAASLPAKKDDEDDEPADDAKPDATEGEVTAPTEPSAEGNDDEPPAATVEAEPKVEEPEPNTDQPTDKEKMKQVYGQIANEAKKRVKDIFGEDFDEFNPEHQAAFTDQVGQIRTAINTHAETLKKVDVAIGVVTKALEQASTKELPAVKIAEMIEDLPHREYEKAVTAYQKGDPSLMLEAIKKVTGKKAADEKAAKIANAAKSKKVEPIAMIGGGGAAPAASDDLDGFNL